MCPPEVGPYYPLTSETTMSETSGSFTLLNLCFSLNFLTLKIIQNIQSTDDHECLRKLFSAEWSEWITLSLPHTHQTWQIFVLFFKSRFSLHNLRG